MAVFTNQATLTYNGTVRSSNITTGELVEVLSVTKTALRDTYAPYEYVTYVVSIVNSGSAPFTGLTVSDNLGNYTYGTLELYPLAYIEGSARMFVNGSPAADPTVEAGPPMAFTGITVPSESNVLLIYEAAVTDFAPLSAGSSIVNTVTVSGGGLAAPITAGETVSVLEDPNLTITKSLSPSVVSDNSTLTYTFIIRNIGSEQADAADNITVTDTFSPILSGLTVTLDSAVLTAGTDYTYDDTTGVFATIPGRITVPAAAFTQDPETGIWNTEPGTAVLTVNGTV